MLYEMLTGHPPYMAENAISVAYRHVHDDVPPPSAAVPGLPEELDAITLRATRREPGSRPVDAGAFLAELRDVVSDLGLRQVPVPPPGQGVRRPERRNDTGTLYLDPPRDAGGQPLPIRPLPRDPEFKPAPPKVRNPEQRRHRRHFLIAVLLIVLLGLGVAAAGWWFGSGRYTSVPKMSMLTVNEARHAAKSAHLKVDVSPNRQHSEDVPVGEVLASSPGGGKKALRGSTVELQLSSGPERYTVPHKLVGLDKAAAQRKLGGMPLTVQYQHAYSDTVATDHVVRVSPTAGTSLRRGQTVTVILSRGPKPFPVPDETGNAVTAAATALRSAGLHVTTSEEFNSTVDSGHVVSQTPASGDVKRGDTVQLLVSKGPQMVRVPDVTRESISQATHDLQAAGFKVSVQSYFDVFGEVVQTKPGANAMAPKGSTIQIIAV
jgi:serine/threonine-protein kinase